MKKTITAAIAILLTLSVIFSFSACKKDGAEGTTANGAAGSDDVVTNEDGSVAAASRSRLNGLPVDSNKAGARTVAIVVENHPSARPQWGFNSPATVIEYEVEGGITRMLWLYDSVEDVPESVGPVRSARHDAVELAAGLDALFVHIGGSTFAYEMFTNYVGTIDHLDGNADESFHYKNTERDTAYEHRSVLVGSKLRTRIGELGTRMTTARNDGFSFAFPGTETAAAGRSAQSVHIGYSYSYAYDFSYDSANGTYTGIIDGNAVRDEYGTACEYKNLVILYADTEDLNDTSGHIDIKLENGGNGVYISGGNAQDITWTKTGVTENLKFYTSDGAELTMNPGRTYIGIVRNTNASSTVIS